MYRHDDDYTWLIAISVTAVIWMFIATAIISTQLSDIEDLISQKLEPSVTCIEKDGKRYCEVADEGL